MTEFFPESAKTGFWVSCCLYLIWCLPYSPNPPQLPRETLWMGWISSWVWPTPPTSAHIVTEKPSLGEKSKHVPICFRNINTILTVLYHRYIIYYTTQELNQLLLTTPRHFPDTFPTPHRHLWIGHFLSNPRPLGEKKPGAWNELNWSFINWFDIIIPQTLTRVIQTTSRHLTDTFSRSHRHP